MYEGGFGGGGVASVLGGAIVLPNTGGSIVLQAVALASIGVGLAILLSTVIRVWAKKTYRSR